MTTPAERPEISGSGPAPEPPAGARPVEAPSAVEPAAVEAPLPVEPAAVEAPLPVEPAAVEAPLPVEPAAVEAPLPVEPAAVEAPLPVEPAAVEAPLPVEPPPTASPSPARPGFNIDERAQAFAQRAESLGREAEVVAERWSTSPAVKDTADLASRVWGLALLAAGLWFLADVTLKLDMPAVAWRDLWPLFLIVFGGIIVLRGMTRRR